MNDGQTDFPQGTDPAFPQPRLHGTDLGWPASVRGKGYLNVRIPNPHKGGNIDWSLMKEILRQAGIKTSDWDKA